MRVGPLAFLLRSVGRLIRRLERDSLVARLRPNRALRAPKLKADYARRRVPLRELFEPLHFLRGPRLSCVPVVLSHF